LKFVKENGKQNTILHLGGFLPCNFWEWKGGVLNNNVKGEHIPNELVTKLN
jgi:hypothetical protein